MIFFGGFLSGYFWNLLKGASKIQKAHFFGKASKI